MGAECGIALTKNAGLKIAEEELRKELNMKDNNLRFNFRMWNKGLKKMTYFGNPQLTWEMPEENKRIGKALFAFELTNNSSLYFGDYKKVMQCIGKLDKNNKPIFEHDIVAFYDTKGTMYKKVVKWDEKLLCYSFGNMPYEEFSKNRFIQPSNCEVIGNIYENKELTRRDA
jgi:uncharacterized phage protein (TIGR01671 family)